MKLRGYWKLNNSLLKNKTFQDSVKLTASDIFTKDDMNNIQKWEYFRFKIREMAIQNQNQPNSKTKQRPSMYRKLEAHHTFEC